MLLREQAIEVINKYVDDDNNIVVPHSFPYKIVPEEVKELLDYTIQLEFKEELFQDYMKYALYEFELPYKFVSQTVTESKIIPQDKISYHYFVEKINKMQENFDKEDDGNMELSKYINGMNEIRELEEFLIDNAQMVLDLLEEVDKEIMDFNNHIKDINNWSKGEKKDGL